MMGEGKHIYKRGYLRGIFIHIYHILWDQHLMGIAYHGIQPSQHDYLPFLWDILWIFNNQLEIWVRPDIWVRPRLG